MNISSISSTTSTSSSGNDSAVKQLQNQLNNLQKQVTSEGQSKDDAKTKQAKIQLLQTQIAQIQAQMQQIKAKKSNQNGSSEQVTQTIANSIVSNNKLDIQA